MTRSVEHTITVDPEYGIWTMHCPHDGLDDEVECYTGGGCKYVEWFENTDESVRGNKQTWTFLPEWHGDYFTFTLDKYKGEQP